MADQFMLKAVLSANAAGMLGTLKAVNQATKTTRKYLLDVGKSANTLASHIGLPFAALSGLAAGFSVAGIKNAMVGLTDMEDSVSKIMDITGMTAGEIKRMQYVAKLSNVPFESLVDSTSKLNKNIHDAASGKNKNLASLFRSLHIETRGANGEIRTASDMLPELADAFNRNENPTLRATMGMALYGKEWKNMVPLLASGAKKLAERNARFKELGLDVGDEKAYQKKLQMISNFGDKMDDLSFVSKGFQNTIAAELIPVIEPLLTGLIKWTSANKEIVASQIKEHVKGFAEYLKTIDWGNVVSGVKAFGKGLGKLVDFVGGTQNALIGLVFFMNIKTIAAFADLLGSTVRLGAGLIRFAIKAVPEMLGALGLLTTETGAAALATDGLTASTKAADAAASGLNKRLKTVLGTLGSIAIAAAPLAAMWGVKEWAGDPNDPETNIKSGERANWMQENLVNPTKGMLSWFGFDKDADIEARRNLNRAELGGEAYPSLFNRGPAQSAGGKFTFEFLNAPAGMRLVDSPKNSSSEIDMSTGPNSFATGMPY